HMLGMLAVERIAATPSGEHGKIITEQIIKQVFTKNAGQHKSFLHFYYLSFALRRNHPVLSWNIFVIPPNFSTVKWRALKFTNKQQFVHKIYDFSVEER